MTGVVLPGDGFEVHVAGSPAAITVRAGGRVVVRTAAAGAIPGLGVRAGGTWHAAGPPTGSASGAASSSAFLPCAGAALRVSVRDDRLTIATEGAPPERLGVSFVLDGHWFGQGTFYEQRWPIGATELALDPFETTDAGWNIQCPAWCTSSGLALLAPGYEPSALGLNDPAPGRLTLHARDRVSLELRVAACAGAADAAVRLASWLGAPARRPPAELFARPIWTTWAEYKRDISQDVVLGYARRIVDEGFPRSVLEIDDMWQAAYGDLRFDPVRFPDPAAMVAELHGLGFAVTCRVPWFVDEAASLFAEADPGGHLVRDPDTGAGALIPWWCNLDRGGGLLDVTRPQTSAWWARRLRELCASTGVDGFKFDAGEASWLPPRLRTGGPTPNLLSDRWAALARLFDHAEARSGWFAQRLGVPMRQWDKFSTWGADNGLAAVVPQALAMSLVGYPFVLPDMVGGNEYGNTCSPELMVRWAQANAFLPIVQFSSAPWRWGEETTARVRRTTRWREDHAALFDRLASEALEGRGPMIGPVFMLAPDDDRALRCGDEFLLSGDMVVAPVVREGATARDVYLPPGRWVDRHDGTVHDGPTVLRDHPAPLDVLPCFGREGSALDAALAAD